MVPAHRRFVASGQAGDFLLWSSTSAQVFQKTSDCFDSLHRVSSFFLQCFASYLFHIILILYLLYSRGYKKRAIAEKMFGTLAIFFDSLKGYFSPFFFFLLSEDS
jgi:hypothetical protein